jgi:hypothetical protein
MRSERDAANPVETTGSTAVSKGARSWTQCAVLAVVPLLLLLAIYAPLGFHIGPQSMAQSETRPAHASSGPVVHWVVTLQLTCIS